MVEGALSNEKLRNDRVDDVVLVEADQALVLVEGVEDDLVDALLVRADELL